MDTEWRSGIKNKNTRVPKYRYPLRKTSLRIRILVAALSLGTANFRFVLKTLQAKHLLSVGLTKALKMRKICLTVAEKAVLCPQKGIEADCEDENKEEKSFAGNFLQPEAFFNC